MPRRPKRTQSSPSPLGRGKIIALVSGKGGSGKTMLAVSMAQGAALSGLTAILVDTDFGTGGLTYYLTFGSFVQARTGLSDVIEDVAVAEELSSWAAVGAPQTADEMWLVRVRLVPIGDQRHVADEVTDRMILSIKAVLREAALHADIVIVDCRGGIDGQSLAVCNLCDEIIVVAETDTTSIRASQHLVNVLSDRKMKAKIGGFVLNKVMDDPLPIAKTANSLLRLDFIGAIPFDIDATRAYIQGRVPQSSTLFSRHVFSILHKIIPGTDALQSIRVLEPREFGTVSLKSPEERLGGLFVGAIGLYLALAIAYVAWGRRNLNHSDIVFTNLYEVIVSLVIANLLIWFALADRVKQTIGRMFRAYRNLARLFVRW